mmetsp:Transcript_33261/g.42504  ORF Transcript_33261/g.42504 Transcript_33261/m.42504 type:complete len:88 (+) Transcript_33261:487-750(+)
MQTKMMAWHFHILYYCSFVYILEDKVVLHFILRNESKRGKEEEKNDRNSPLNQLKGLEYTPWHVDESHKWIHCFHVLTIRNRFGNYN